MSGTAFTLLDSPNISFIKLHSCSIFVWRLFVSTTPEIHSKSLDFISWLFTGWWQHCVLTLVVSYATLPEQTVTSKPNVTRCSLSHCQYLSLSFSQCPVIQRGGTFLLIQHSDKIKTCSTLCEGRCFNTSLCVEEPKHKNLAEGNPLWVWQ